MIWGIKLTIDGVDEGDGPRGAPSAPVEVSLMLVVGLSSPS